MVKSIIKRIIVGVGIALCLMYIKGSLIGEVQAMEVQKATPTGIAYLPQGSSSASSLTMGTISPSGLQIPIYAANTNFSQMSQVTYFYFNFSSNSDLDISQPLDIHFLIYSSGFFTQYDDNPYNIILRTGYNDTATAYTCSVDSPTSTAYYSNNQPSTVIGHFSNVHCNNIALNSKNFRIFLLSDYFVPSGTGTVGISKLTLYPHSSNQSVVNAIDNNTQAQQDTNDTLNDSTTDDPSSDISSMNSKLASNNSITQLLTLPIQLFQNILNSVNGSCSSFSLGSLYGHNLTLPCINLSSLLGSTLYGIIDILISGLFILSFRKKMVDIFNNMTSLNDRGNEVE